MATDNAPLVIINMKEKKIKPLTRRSEMFLQDVVLCVLAMEECEGYTVERKKLEIMQKDVFSKTVQLFEFFNAKTIKESQTKNDEGDKDEEENDEDDNADNDTDKGNDLDEEQIKTIMSQADVSRTVAEASLKKHGNIVDAILELTP